MSGVARARRYGRWRRSSDHRDAWWASTAPSGWWRRPGRGRGQTRSSTWCWRCACVALRRGRVLGKSGGARADARRGSGYGARADDASDAGRRSRDRDRAIEPEWDTLIIDSADLGWLVGWRARRRTQSDIPTSEGDSQVGRGRWPGDTGRGLHDDPDPRSQPGLRSCSGCAQQSRVSRTPPPRAGGTRLKRQSRRHAFLAAVTGVTIVARKPPRA